MKHASWTLSGLALRWNRGKYYHYYLNINKLVNYVDLLLIDYL